MSSRLLSGLNEHLSKREAGSQVDEKMPKRKKLDHILNKTETVLLEKCLAQTRHELFLIDRDVAFSRNTYKMLKQICEKESTEINEKELNELKKDVKLCLVNSGFKKERYGLRYITNQMGFNKAALSILSCESVIKARQDIEAFSDLIDKGYEQRFVLQKQIVDLHKIASKGSKMGLLEDDSNLCVLNAYPILSCAKRFFVGEKIKVRKPLYSKTDKGLQASFGSPTGTRYNISITGIGTDAKGQTTYKVRYSDGDKRKDTPESYIRDSDDTKRSVKSSDWYDTNIVKINGEGPVKFICVSSHPDDGKDKETWISTNSNRLGDRRVKTELTAFDSSKCGFEDFSDSDSDDSDNY